MTGQLTAEWTPGVRAQALLHLVRPVNLLLVFGGVMAGALLTSGALAFSAVYTGSVIAAGMSAVLLAAGANSINDAYDVEIDRVNRPERPLVMGVLTPVAARVIWAVMTVAGILLAAMLGPAHVGIAVGAAAVLFVYAWRLKRLPLVGNVAVASMVALTLIYGALVVSGSLADAMVGAGFAFLVNFAREIVKDVEDVRGDAAGGAMTLAVMMGVDTALGLVLVVIALILVALPMPFLFLGFGSLYLVIALAAGALLLRCAWLILRAPYDGACVDRSSLLLKVVMLIGLVALVAG
jgi:geranylgeranylglycerol-phosphate geranylgeranyltransferase